MEVLNVKAPLAVTDRLSPALSCKTRPVPLRPVTVPPMVKEVVDEVEEDEPLVPDWPGVPLQPNRISETVAIKSDLVKAFMFVIVLLMLHELPKAA